MGLFDFLTEGLKSQASYFLQDLKNEAMVRMKQEVRRVKGNIMKDLMFAILMSVSIIFLLISATYFFIEYLELTKTLSFLITGIVLLLISLLIKLTKR